MNDESFYSGHFKLLDFKGKNPPNIENLRKGTLLLVKPNLVPGIFMGVTKDKKITVFYMQEEHDELSENILLVGRPQFTKTGI